MREVFQWSPGDLLELRQEQLAAAFLHVAERRDREDDQDAALDGAGELLARLVAVTMKAHGIEERKGSSVRTRTTPKPTPAEAKQLAAERAEQAGGEVDVAGAVAEALGGTSDRQ